MNQNYSDIIQQLSQLLLQAIEERESALCQNVEQLDSELAKLLRFVGLQVMSGLLNSLAQQVRGCLKTKVKLAQLAASLKLC